MSTIETKKPLIIPIVLSTSDLYSKYVPVTIYSVLRNANKGYTYRFYVFHTHLRSVSKQHIKNIPSEDLPEYSIQFVNLKEHIKGVNLYVNGHLGIETWYRFFIPQILKEYDKIIYLDCDLIIRGDISKLYHEDIGANYLGVCKNPVTFTRYKLKDINIDPDKYFNAGVLLYNINEWRKNNLIHTCLRLTTTYPNLTYLDQDVLNIACKDKVHYLDYRWNFAWQFFSSLDKLSTDELQLYLEAEKDFYIIHYTTSIKPWSHPTKKYADLWWKYANQLGMECEKIDYRGNLEHWWWRSQCDSLNLDTPKTFNEKIQWLKLYDSTPIKTRLTDKYLVREWIKEKIGEKYLIPLIGVYDCFEEIDFEKLPNHFVIKCNCGRGYNIVVKDKKQVDKNIIMINLKKWMHENFAFEAGFELYYRDIQPKIIIEEYVGNIHSESLNKFCFYCFGGEVKYVKVIPERTADSYKTSFYDLNWEKQSWWENILYEGLVAKPRKLKDMINLAKKLCHGFSFVCVDLYCSDDDSIYFGKMSFSPFPGCVKWSSPEINRQLGNMIKLPQLAYNIDTGNYYKLPRFSKLKSYFFFPYYFIGAKFLRKNFLLTEVERFIKKILWMRIDAKNLGNSQNSLVVKGMGATISQPVWMASEQGLGNHIGSPQLKQELSITAIRSGKLTLSFRGPDRCYNGKRCVIWTDYSSIKINGKEILSEPVSTWYGKPFSYEQSIDDGQELTLKIEQTYHSYSVDELQDIISKQYMQFPYICTHSREFAKYIHQKIRQLRK